MREDVEGVVTCMPTRILMTPEEHQALKTREDPEKPAVSYRVTDAFGDLCRNNHLVEWVGWHPDTGLVRARKHWNFQRRQSDTSPTPPNVDDWEPYPHIIGTKRVDVVRQHFMSEPLPSVFPGFSKKTEEKDAPYDAFMESLPEHVREGQKIMRSCMEFLGDRFVESEIDTKRMAWLFGNNPMAPDISVPEASKRRFQFLKSMPVVLREFEHDEITAIIDSGQSPFLFLKKMTGLDESVLRDMRK